ncbi:MAG TPA: hypothetical protein VEL47_02265, partial [Myxococcota bacterium]|nr:hypothetical protein [Myxococcota bacterium]
MHPAIPTMTIPILLILVATTLNATDQEKKPDNQTVIEDLAPEKTATKVDYLKDKTSDQTPGDAAMLYHIPGLTLTESGGPLASSQIRYHGLSNARMPVDLEGLSMTNPLHGVLDANALFLFAAEKLTADTQSLSIKLPKVEKPQAKGVIGYGSHNTFKFGASAGTPLSTYSSIFAAMQMAVTNGDFSYSSPDVAVSERKNFYRRNNDQHRLQALVKFERLAPSQKAHAMLAFNSHEGGIAGFAFSPTTDLRQRVTFCGVKAGISQRVKNAEFGFDVSNSV